MTNPLDPQYVEPSSLSDCYDRGVKFGPEADALLTLVLVEDNPADANWITEMLEESSNGQFHIIHCVTLQEAIITLEKQYADVILLDLVLPDSIGVETIKLLRARVADVPIVVLSGIKDEQLALTCIAASAQDYITKEELQPASLRRTIGYAISRQHEAKVRELQKALRHYRSLSSAATGTAVTAALAGSGAVRQRYPEVFRSLVNNYLDLLEIYLDHLVVQKEKPHDQMERLITRLGDTGGGPRDLLDVHLAALDTAICGQETERTRSLAIEGRLLALEMMGLLVDFYRVGVRRRSHEKG